MGCPICSTLEQAFEAGQSEYINALCAPYHQVCKRFAAYKNVELERARIELEEHRMVCAIAAREHSRGAVGAVLEMVRRDEVGADLLELSA